MRMRIVIISFMSLMPAVVVAQKIASKESNSLLSSNFINNSAPSLFIKDKSTESFFDFFAPSIDIKFFVNGKPDVRHIEEDAKSHVNGGDIYFNVVNGNDQIVEHEFDPNYYSVAGLGVTYSFQHNKVLRSGLGVDLNLYRCLSSQKDKNPEFGKITVGLIYSPEIIFGSFSFIGGLGVYVKHFNYASFSKLYQRAGVKYMITNRLSIGANIRAENFQLAEFFELNIGYSIKWSNK